MIRTWQIELFVVASIEFAVALVFGRTAFELLGALAVTLSFAHGQVADRLAENEAARLSPDVECHRWATRYFVGKEIVWISYFVGLGAWSALVGAGLFVAYPLWRRWWRRPRRVDPERWVTMERTRLAAADRELNRAARARLAALRDSDPHIVGSLRAVVRLTGGWDGDGDTT